MRALALAYNITADLESHVIAAFDAARIEETIKRMKAGKKKAKMDASEDKYIKGILKHLKTAHRSLAPKSQGSLKKMFG